MAKKEILSKLHIVFPDGSEQEIEIGKSPFSIGRDVKNDLQLPDPNVSRNHARLLFEDDQMQVIDLKSSNGTFVGEKRLPPNEPHRIKVDETFKMGPYTLKLVAVPKPVEAKPKVEPPKSKAKPPAPKPEPEPEPEKRVVLKAEKAPSAPPKKVPTKTKAVEAPPPAPPPEEPPERDDGLPLFDEIMGIPPDRSRYLDHLPPFFSESPFLGQFLLSFEGLMVPIEQIVDNFDLYLNPDTTLAFFLEQLATWLGLTLDEKWPVEKQRAVVAEAAELYRLRGTRAGLTRFLEIYGEVTPTIKEPKRKPNHFDVVLEIPKRKRLDRATIERIIEANKPAHATYSLEILRKGSTKRKSS
jgi:phage tail-like protein